MQIDQVMQIGQVIVFYIIFTQIAQV